MKIVTISVTLVSVFHLEYRTDSEGLELCKALCCGSYALQTSQPQGIVLDMGTG